MNSNPTVLEVNDVSHTYGRGNQSVEAIKNVSLQINTGEIGLLRGQSGSGKTTLLLACGGMLKPTFGKVEVDQKDLYSRSASERNMIRSKSIGYVFQTLELVPYLTVLENVTLHNNSSRETAIEWLERVGLMERIRHRPDELSHGQRQRIAMVRAIVHQPKLLIADEPTGNLDEENSALVYETLRHFADSGGAVLIASHDSSILNLVDKRFDLADSRVCESTIQAEPNSKVASKS